MKVVASMKKFGFTLVELLVVMVIILILAGIGLKHLSGAKEKAKNLQVSAGVHEIHVALEAYAIDHNGFYPGVNWEVDSTGVILDNAPGVLGGVESGSGEKDFQNWVGNPVAYHGDQTPRVRYIDVLLAKGYLTQYPANPFITATGATKSQMTNLFWYSVNYDTGLFSFNDELSVDWDRLTDRASGETMKINWEDKARGHFTYIPLGPVNNQGWDFGNNWAGLNDAARSHYYKYCRNYILVGWGASRRDTSQSAAFSSEYFNSNLNGFDIDKDLTIDIFENNLVSTCRPEQADSAGVIPTNFGATVGTAPQQFVDINDAFAGATIMVLGKE